MNGDITISDLEAIFKGFEESNRMCNEYYKKLQRCYSQVCEIVREAECEDDLSSYRSEIQSKSDEFQEDCENFEECATIYEEAIREIYGLGYNEYVSRFDSHCENYYDFSQIKRNFQRIMSEWERIEACNASLNA